MPIADRFRLIWTPFLKKHNAGWLQAVGLVCPTVLGSGGEFTLRVGGRRYTALKTDLLRYPSEHQHQDEPVTYLWLIPRPARPVAIRASWRVPIGGAVYRDSMRLQPAEMRDVHVVFKTHLDLGYTARFEEVVRQYQTTLLDRLLSNLDATCGRRAGKRFVWTVSTWLLEQLLDPQHVAPEQRKRLERHIRRGAVVWGLVPFTTHSEFFGLEEMCRSIYAARRLAERFGVPLPRAAKLTDVPAHPAALGMALAAAGGKFLEIGANPESMPPTVPPLFWWKLPDGKRLLCHYHGCYGTPLLPPQDWRYRDWPAIQMTSDNVGPPNFDALDRMDWIERHFDSPVCRIGRLEDFAEAVMRRAGDELPVIEKEFTDWWSYGLGSQARAVGLARVDKHRLPAAETLRTLAGWARGEAGQENGAADSAYQQLALFTEHTWGDHATDMREAEPRGNLYRSEVFSVGSESKIVQRWTASWRDKASFAEAAHKATSAVQEAAVAAWDGQVAPSLSRGRTGIAIYNSLSWARGGVVRVAARGLPRGEFELIDPTSGGRVLYERLADGSIELPAPTVPACGYLVLEVRSSTGRSRPGQHAEWDDRMLTLHTSDYSLQFHRAGGLARWHDRARSTQWCSDQVEFPMGTYLYEMPGGDRLREFARKVHSNHHGVDTGFHRRDYQEMSSFGPAGGGPAAVCHEITPLYARVSIEADCPIRKVPGRHCGDAQRYRTTFTIYRGGSEVYIRMQLTGKRPTYAVEAGYAFFPFSGEEPYYLIDRIAQLIDPSGDLARGVNAAHMVVHRGVRIQQDHTGMNFYPLHTPLIGFGKPGAYRFDAGGKHPDGIIYANLFNNCWGTNFALWQGGDFTFDFVLQPTGNNDWDGGLLRGGAEFFQPLAASVIRGTGSAGERLPSAQSLLSIDTPVVQMVTLKPASFGAGSIARLWNSDPEPVRARLSINPAVGAARITRCDLLEQPTGVTLRVSRDGQAVVTLGPNEIATLLIERRGRKP